MASSAICDRKVGRANRRKLEAEYRKARKMSNDWLRHQILENNRIDILAAVVLGLTVKPFHVAMMRFQFLHPDNLQLAFRGSGKTTTCTVTKIIHLLCKNRNIRIGLVSKTVGYAGEILKQIKAHLENNERLIELFGTFYDPKSNNKWSETEIEVVGRTGRMKEPNVKALGIESLHGGPHFDVIIEDDIVDEKNAATALQRGKLKKLMHQTLLPMLEPPDGKVQHRGEHHRLGTRYHYDDYWGHLIATECKHSHQIIRALVNGKSPWPEKFPAKFFVKIRNTVGLIVFNAQYQNDTEAMKGEIFLYDHCQRLDEDAFPSKKKGLRIFMGVDLAISEEESSDMFAIVVIGVAKDRSAYYVLDYYEGHLRFRQQVSKVYELADRWKPLSIGVETNQYQKALYHELKDVQEERNASGKPEYVFRPIHTDKDKRLRAQKRTPIFENMRMFFRAHHTKLIEHFVLFTGKKGTRCDIFDAYDHAVSVSMRKRVKMVEMKVGVL